MSTRPAVVIQITDTHLFSDKCAQLKGVTTYGSFNKVLSHSIESYPLADAYLFTGDLSQDGSPESYLDFKSSIKRVEAPCFLIPGNHDDVANIKKYLVSATTRFDQYTDLGPWRIIFINTQTPGEEYGTVDDAALNGVRKSINPRQSNHLICMHHPPIPLGSEWLDKIGLRNGKFFLDVVDQIEGSRVLMWGHAHQQYFQQSGSLALLGTPSTCVQFKPGSPELEIDDLPPGYRVLNLFENGQIETRVVRVE